MGSKKIIVPQGLINPNETTIIEIPAGVDSEATLIARSNPDDYCPPASPSSRASPRRLAASTRESPSSKRVRKVTSITTTIIDSSPPPTPPSYTQCPARQPVDRKHNRPTERSLPPTQLYPLYVNPATTAPKCPAKCPNQRNKDHRPNCLPNCVSQSCPAAAAAAAAKPRPQSGRQSPLQQSYHNTLSTQFQTSTPKFTSAKRLFKKVCAESSSELKFQPPFNSTAISPDESFSNDYCPGSASSRKNRAMEPRESCAAGQNQTNLTEEVKRHLAEIEISERQQINRDLEMFQQARRRLVEDTTKLSSSKENDLMRMPPKK